MLPKRSQPYRAYACVHMRVGTILSLFTIFNMEMGNRGNNADFVCNTGLFTVKSCVTEDRSR